MNKIVPYRIWFRTKNYKDTKILDGVSMRTENINNIKSVKFDCENPHSQIQIIFHSEHNLRYLLKCLKSLLREAE